MDFASSLFGFLYQCGDAFAFLVLAACGLAVIFGMMGVINLAHGEFIMCGAYAVIALTATIALREHLLPTLAAPFTRRATRHGGQPHSEHPHPAASTGH